MLEGPLNSRGVCQHVTAKYKMGAAASGCCHEDKCCSSSALPTSPKEIVDVERSSACGSYDTGEPRKSSAASSALSRQTSHYSRYDVLSEMRQLSVDNDIIRAIPLHVTLRNFGKLWSKSPLDLKPASRARLWELSAPASKFDLFLSHTWQSPGKWKYVSLLLRSGSRTILCAWALAVSAAFGLCILDVLDSPLEYVPQHIDVQGSCPLGFWIMLFGSLATAITPFMAPYLPCQHRCACFLDAVSIHQVDDELQERGVYGIGGFLKVSDELLVLLTDEYLTRLWCVFEIAMFRYANPTGRITMVPAFAQIAASFLWFFVALVSFLLWSSLAMEVPVDLVLVAWLLTLLPVAFLVQILRRSCHSKHTLVLRLEQFDLKNAECRLEFDRRFVHESITTWYGSVDAFNTYVRGPLKDELYSSSSNFQMPFLYYLITTTPAQSASLEELLGIIKAGSSWDIVLTHILAHNIGLCISIMLSLNFLLMLCERFSAPQSRLLLDCAKSALLFLLYVMAVGLGAGSSLLAARLGFFPALCWAVLSLCTACVCFRGRGCPRAWAERAHTEPAITERR